MMKYCVLIIVYLISVSASAQNILSIEAERNYTMAVIKNNVKIYISNCEDSVFTSVLYYDIISHRDKIPGNTVLGATVRYSFKCVSSFDTATIEKIFYQLHSKNESPSIWFIHPLKTEANGLLFYVIIFTDKSYIRFRRKANHQSIVIQHPSGHLKVKDAADMFRYSQRYIISEIDNSLVVYRMYQ